MKKDYNSLDYVKQKFDSAFLETPDSLSESAIKEKLGNLPEQSAPKKAKRIPLKQIISIAACFILVVTTLTSFNALSGKIPPVTGVKNGSTSSAVSTFRSYGELYDYLKTVKGKKYFFCPVSNNNLIGTLDGADSSAALASSETYIQVEGVEEADTIKTYNGYIFNNAFTDIAIYKADEYNTKLAYSLNICEKDVDILETWIEDFIISDNTLAVNVHSNETNETTIVFYDITNPENPRLINRFVQSGRYYTSRIIGNTEYLVTRQYIKKASNSTLPYTISNDKKEKVKIENIFYTNCFADCTYLTISAINIKTGEVTDETKTILGNCAEVYCNEQNMYIVNYSYNYETDFVSDGSANEYNEDSPELESIDEKTQLIKMSVENGKITPTASADIDGYINNQFSMDEKDGLFRIATTSDDNNVLKNNLYILNDSLQLIGNVKGFAENEEIKAVRFINDTAYVITYEQTDPLFIIDLSNPQSPKIEGEIEITGFSSQLIPINENLLLGIGTDTAELYSFKLVLFDISNNKEPKILDTVVFENCYSETKDNHKALIINQNKKYYAVPYSEYTNNHDEIDGIIQFEITNNKIKIKNKFVNNNTEDAFWRSRCVYVGDYLYLFNKNNMPYVFYAG